MRALRNDSRWAAPAAKLPAYRRDPRSNASTSRHSVRRMSNDLRHRLGRAGEQHAAAHLERRGLTVVVRNHRTRWGEIDLIAVDDRRIVFCEVKTSLAGALMLIEELR